VYDTRRPDYVPAAPKNSYTFHIPKIHQKIYKPPDLIMMIDAVSEHYKMDTHLIRAIVHTESSFKHRAVSPKGAIGMMQLMPGTAKRFKVADPHDPIYNVIGGVQYMKWLLLHFNGDHVKAIAAYNAGEGAVEKYNGIPPYSETQAYVPRVMTLWKNKTIQPDPKPAANTASQPPTKQNKTPGRP
jgi:soluble lytic murein transglycosylase-like protein